MEYLIAFSSYYKAAYAQEILQKNKTASRIGKTPANLLKSCGYSLTFKTNNIDKITELLTDKGISYSGVYNV